MSSGGPFVWRSEMICVILVEGISKNIFVKYFEFVPVVQKEMPFIDTSYLELWRSFVSQSKTICAILVERIIGEHFCEII